MYIYNPTTQSTIYDHKFTTKYPLCEFHFLSPSYAFATLITMPTKMHLDYHV
jgi:hypothetical protein